MEVTYIEDLATMAYLCHKPKSPEGFEEITGDLNCGAFGRYIQLYVKRTSDLSKAITHIDVFSSSVRDIDIPPAYVQLPQDLNSLAGGKYIYLCYSKKMDRPPITDLRIICYPHVQPYKPWVRVGNNCNEGTFGKPIYITYRRTEPEENRDDTIVGIESKPGGKQHVGGDGDVTTVRIEITPEEHVDDDGDTDVAGKESTPGKSIVADGDGESTIVRVELTPEEKQVDDGGDTDVAGKESTPGKSHVADGDGESTIVRVELTPEEKQVDDGGDTDVAGKESTPEINVVDVDSGETTIVSTELKPEENHVGSDYTIIGGNESTSEEGKHVGSSDSK